MAAIPTITRQSQKGCTWLTGPPPHRLVHLSVGFHPVLLLALPIILAIFAHGVQSRLLVVTVAGSGVADTCEMSKGLLWYSPSHGRQVVQQYWGFKPTSVLLRDVGVL